MVRLLGFLQPALLGVALVWFLVPVGNNSGANGSDTKGENALSEDDKKVLSVALSALIRSPRDLFGKPLQIITPDNQFTLEDMEGADAKFLSRAYQECKLMMDPELRRGYLESIGETDQESVQFALDDSQMTTYAGVIRVMTDLLRKES